MKTMSSIIDSIIQKNADEAEEALRTPLRPSGLLAGAVDAGDAIEYETSVCKCVGGG